MRDEEKQGQLSVPDEIDAHLQRLRLQQVQGPILRAIMLRFSNLFGYHRAWEAAASDYAAASGALAGLFQARTALAKEYGRAKRIEAIVEESLAEDRLEHERRMILLEAERYKAESERHKAESRRNMLRILRDETERIGEKPTAQILHEISEIYALLEKL